jgi:hypothetical protein
VKVELSERLAAQEKEMIEDALRECDLESHVVPPREVASSTGS